MSAMDGQNLIEVKDLGVTFFTDRGAVAAVDGISYAIAPGRTLGVVGESGCGKSVTALALLGLVPPPGRITQGEILFAGDDLASASDEQMEAVRGNRIAMIFQEPMTSLNPVVAIGNQIAEAFVIHQDASRKDARDGAIQLLAKVGIPEPMMRADDYPHQLSGGMRQRAMIAMALACKPALLIADEPTTALDVTIQAQILELMAQIQDEMGMAVQFISHNLGVVSEVADDVMVMYAGRIVEAAPAADIFANPRHPYTRGLIETLPRIGERKHRLPAIPGMVPDPLALPRGCHFSDRCPLADDDCREGEPALTGNGHRTACFKAGP